MCSVKFKPTQRKHIYCGRSCRLRYRRKYGKNEKLLLTVSERFWRCVVKTRGCWLWLGSTLPSRRAGEAGYGHFGLPDGRTVLSHRFAYEDVVGLIPDDKQVHHKCKNRSCVKPHHLELLTQWEHAQLHAPNRKSCPHGHRYTKANTYINPEGRRECRTCCNIRSLQRYYRRRDKRREESFVIR